MVDLEKIKRDVKDLCDNIKDAYKSLGSREKEYAEASLQIDKLKTDIAMLNDRKGNIKESVSAEETAAGSIIREHSAVKTKYRKLIDNVRLAHLKILSDNEAEIETQRVEGISILTASKVKLASEIDILETERDNMMKEYNDYKEKLRELKEGIVY